MSKGEQDSEYRPKVSKVKPSRSSRRTRRGDPVDYSEAELESDTESEITLSGTILEVDSPVKREESIREDEWELNQTWTPGTLIKQSGKTSRNPVQQIS